MNRLLLFLLLLLSMDVQSQTLNVTNYAAKGDAQQVWVSTTAGSVIVGFTNTLSAADIGKTIEIFLTGNTNIGVNTLNAYGAGPIVATNCQDLVDTITNVSGTNAYVSGDIPSFTANNNNIISGSPSYDSSGHYVLNGINPEWQYNYTNGAHDTGVQAYSVATSTFISSSNSVILTGTPNTTVTATIVSGMAYCVYGTNNVNPFAACIAACPTNAIVYIPHGTISPWGTTNAYLLIPYQAYTNDSGTIFDGSPYLLTAAGMIINRGGLYFEGDGEGQTILMGQGAGKAQLVQGNLIRGMRAAIVHCAGPVTNNFPVVFTNMTLDGGMQKGLNDEFQGTQPANWVDSLGWDNDDHAIAYVFAVGASNPEPLWANLTLANCEFHHFRGEMIINATGTATIENITVTNCVFDDGEATAENIEVACTSANCIYTNLYQIAEFYLAYITNNASWYMNCYGSNLLHAGVVLNGGSPTNQPFYFTNNVTVGAGTNINLSGINNLFATTPASNVKIQNSKFICSNNCSCIVLDEPTPQGSSASSNIWISGNTFYNPFNLFATYGSSLGTIANVVVSNNVNADASLWGGNYAVADIFGPITNCLFVDNNFNPPGFATSSSKAGFTSGASGYQYITVATNTTYHYGIFHFSQVTTDILSYASGPWYQTVYTTPGDAIVLKDFDGAQIPPGAQMVVDNTTNGDPSGGIYRIYLNSAMSRSIMTTNGQINVFNWSNEWVQAGQMLPTATTNYWPWQAEATIILREGFQTIWKSLKNNLKN